MKNFSFTKKSGLKISGRLVLAYSLALLVSACGGGSGMGYKESDNVDRAPYFSVADTAVQNGTVIDVQITKPVTVKFYDDRSLKSYYLIIDGAEVGSGELSGVSALIELNLKDLPDGEGIKSLEGGHSYSAKLVAVDSADNSTVAHFTVNAKEFYEKMLLIGGATPVGWNRESALPMTPDENIPGQFSWSGPLVPGTFKIATDDIPECWCGFDWILAPTADATLTKPEYVINGADNQWKVEVTGDYTITVDQRTKSIFIGKPSANIYMVGDATPAGWSVDNPVVFDRDPLNVAVFTKEVKLVAGEFKFSDQKVNWGLGRWIYALSANAPVPTTATSYDITEPDASHDDVKWRVTSDMEGTYKITINLDEKTILAEKQ